MIHLIQSDLHRKFKQETGLSAMFFSEKYIDWLEERVLNEFNQKIIDEKFIKEFNEKMAQLKVEGIEC